MKRVTSRDVAKYAGVSQSTVSFVLNDREDIKISESTKHKVVSAAKALNYSPLKNRKNGEGSNLIGIMVPTVTNPFYPMLTKEIEEYAAAQGFKTLLCNTYRKIENEKFYLNLLAEIHIDGIVYGFTPSFPEVTSAISEYVPIVIIGEKQDDCPIDTLALNSFMAGRLVAGHLYGLGHRKVAFVSSPLNGLSLSRQKRLQGVVSVFHDYGSDEYPIVKAESFEREADDGAYEIELGYKLTRELLADTDITAIIGVNDMVAFGAIHAIQDMKLKVPDDISVCGFDNTYISKTAYPKITTVDHFTAQRSRLAMNILIDKIRKVENKRYRVEYEPDIIIRESTGISNDRR